ncbi:MAG: S53 family peptidase [Actinomycetota bacterium]
MRRVAFAVVAVLVLSVFEVGATTHATTDAPSEFVRVCPPAEPGYATCFATMRRSAKKRKKIKPLTPALIKKIHRWSTSPTAGAGKTIAIVIPFHNPHLESDLAVFSSRYGLPQCTIANTCLSIVNARGTDPPVDPGWALEGNLDVQWAHAIAPGAKILVMVASSNLFVDMFHGVWKANELHPEYLSMSWGGPEFELQGIFDPVLDPDDPAYDAAGVSHIAASGDTGGQPTYPSNSPFVTSVGSTSVQLERRKLKRESGWKHTGGGCSVYEPATPAQAAFPEYAATGCAGRATPDVVAFGDVRPGVWTYISPDTFGSTGGWVNTGATSLSAPMFAGRAAVSGLEVDEELIYSDTLTFKDITRGHTLDLNAENGFPCTVGYDLCSGRGVWIGP